MSQIEEIYEPETTDFLIRTLKDGDNVIIAGAHRGYFASLASSLVGRGIVYAFEPEKENFKILKETVKGKRNVKLFNLALGDKECTAKFFINDDDNGGHALWDISMNLNNLKTRESQKVTNVEVRKLDDIFEEEALKLILLDVEGSELSALKGAINTIVDLEVPHIICEVNNFALEKCGTSQILLRSFMKTYGYKEYSLDGKPFNVSIKQELFAYDNENKEVVFNMLFSRDIIDG